jgi:hypothetical protein
MLDPGSWMLDAGCVGVGFQVTIVVSTFCRTLRKICANLRETFIPMFLSPQRRRDAEKNSISASLRHCGKYREIFEQQNCT